MRARTSVMWCFVAWVSSAQAWADPIRTTVTFGSAATGNVFPFGAGPGERNEYLGLYQQIYVGERLGGAFTIHEVAFRTMLGTDLQSRTASSRFSLRLGTTGMSPLSPRPSYEGNRRADLTEVFNGRITVLASGHGDFDFVVPLARPFTVPWANLLLEVFVYENVAGATPLAAGSSPDTGRVFNLSGTGPVRANGGYGLLTRFTGDLEPTAAPVPEPATLTLLGCGLLGVYARARKRGTATLLR